MVSIDINPVCNCLAIPPHCVLSFNVEPVVAFLILEDSMMLISCYSLDFLVSFVLKRLCFWT